MVKLILFTVSVILALGLFVGMAVDPQFMMVLLLFIGFTGAIYFFLEAWLDL